MKKIISLALIMILWPTFSFAGRYESSRYWNEPSRHYRQPPPYSRENRHGYYSHTPYRHNDDWIVPLAIFGTVLGIMALSQQQYGYAPPPPPPQRMCRDTYNYVDQYGRYLYSEYVDRPCND